MGAETREYVVITAGAVTAGEKVFRQGEVANAREFGEDMDYLFETNSVRWADESEVRKFLARKKAEEKTTANLTK